MCSVFILVLQQLKSSRVYCFTQNKSAYLRSKNTIKELLLKSQIFQVKQL